VAEQDYVNLFAAGQGGYPTAAGAAFSNFTALQDISPTPLPVVYPYQLRIGHKLELEAEGSFSTTGTPTLGMAFLWGATAGAAGSPAVLCQSTSITTGSGAASWPWHLRARGIITAVGSSGSIIISGEWYYGTSLSAVTVVPVPITLALRTVTIDTTTLKLLGVGAVWNTASASNSITVNNFTATLQN